MSLPKDLANKVLSNLDSAAARIEKLAASKKIDGKLAAKLIGDIDAFADKFEVNAYGAESFKRRQAKVIKMDADEPYMRAFDNTVNPIITEKDEPYMHNAGHGARWAEDILTFDADRSSVVADRPVYSVRDQSPLSNGGKTKLNPSEKGPLRKSTASTKQWAD